MSEGFVVSDDESGQGTSLAAWNASVRLNGLPAITADLPHARVLQARLPQQWPQGEFDLIVFSEMGYYLDADDLHGLIDRALAALAPDGQLLACHWRPDIEGCPLNAEAVHDILAARLSMHRLFSHHEQDFLLDLWSRDGTSVAEQEFSDDRHSDPGAQ